MIIKVNLSPEEVASILASVLQYNGYHPVEVKWQDQDGVIVAAPAASISCELEGGLKVRVTQESKSDWEERLNQFRRATEGLHKTS